MSAIPDQFIQAFRRQCEEYVPFPLDEADDVLDLPKKSRERILIDIYLQDFLERQPHFRNKPMIIVRGIVRNALVKNGLL